MHGVIVAAGSGYSPGCCSPTEVCRSINDRCQFINEINDSCPFIDSEPAASAAATGTLKSRFRLLNVQKVSGGNVAEAALKNTGSTICGRFVQYFFIILE